MSSPHSEPRPTEQGIDLYRPDSEAPVESDVGADVPAPAPEEAAETAPQGAVIPFDPTITAAKTHLERLIERIAEDTDALTDRMAGMEPRQQAVEQELAREAETVTALAEEVGRKLELMAADQERLAGEGIDAFNRASDAIALLDERVAELEPTPEKLELVAAKLERVNERLTAWTAQLEERVDALDDGQRSLEERASRLEEGAEALGGRLDDLAEDHRQVKGETGRLLRSTDVLTVLLERLEARFASRTRLGISALASLLLLVGAVALFGYDRLDTQRVAVAGKLQGLERTSVERTAAVSQEVTQVSTDLADSLEGLELRHQGVLEELVRLEEAMTPHYDPTSNAITVPMHDEDWLLKRDPAHYAVELLVAANKGELFNYVRHFQPHLDRPVAYTKVEQRGRDWYLLTYGDFPTAAEARAALGELPGEMLRYRPRVHLNGSLQRMVAG